MTMTVDTMTLRISVCHIKEVINAKVPFIYVMYIQNTSIFTWELLGNFTYHWELNENWDY